MPPRKARSKKESTSTSKVEPLPEVFLLSNDDCKKFLSLVELHGPKNELHRMADRIQANLVVTGIKTIQGIYQTALSLDGADIDSLNKMTNSFNRAMASVNVAMNSLNITAQKRGEEPDIDPLAAFLLQGGLEDEIPPTLQEEYLLAKKDKDRLDGNVSEAEVEMNKNAVAELSQPLDSFLDNDDDIQPDNVVDVELEGLTHL